MNEMGVFDFSTMEDAGLAGQSLPKVFAVAFMSKRGIVLAGHDDGTISIWCARSGKYEGRFEKANADPVLCLVVLCLDVSESENTVASGHAGGSIVV